MNTVRVKRGDVGVIFADTLTAEGLTSLDDVVDVLFVLHHNRTGDVVTEAATIVDSATRAVEYVAQAGDLDVEGSYRHEWEATFADGAVLTFPSSGYNEVIVVADLNPPES